MYTAMYLPVDKPKVEGCMLMNVRGEVFEWDGIDQGWHSSCRVAELFIVKEEYNMRTIVGQPRGSAKKWINPGDAFSEEHLTAYEEVGDVLLLGVRCPRCRTFHS